MRSGWKNGLDESYKLENTVHLVVAIKASLLHFAFLLLLLDTLVNATPLPVGGCLGMRGVRRALRTGVPKVSWASPHGMSSSSQ